LYSRAAVDNISADNTLCGHSAIAEPHVSISSRKRWCSSFSTLLWNICWSVLSWPWEEVTGSQQLGTDLDSPWCTE